MHKKITMIFFIALLAICACGKAEKQENQENRAEEALQEEEQRNHDPEVREITRDAYFLDTNTIFSAEIPENWYDEVFLGTSRQAILRFTCLDSEPDGFWETNFFYIAVGRNPERKRYDSYKRASYQCMDGQKGIRYSKEYEDELMEEYRYYAETIVLPGGAFAVNSYEEKDPHLTVGRYERNKDQIEAFYHSILYQERAEQIGKTSAEALTDRGWIRMHLHNDDLNVVAEVPEGIFYESATGDYGSGEEEFRLRLYLDEEKKNYVDLCSDSWMMGERIVIEKGYQADFLDSGELVHYYEWKNEEQMWGEWQGEEFRQCWYTFGEHKTGAAICVEKEKTELYEIAQRIVKSIRFQ